MTARFCFSFNVFFPLPLLSSGDARPRWNRFLFFTLLYLLSDFQVGRDALNPLGTLRGERRRRKRRWRKKRRRPRRREEQIEGDEEKRWKEEEEAWARAEPIEALPAHHLIFLGSNVP